MSDKPPRDQVSADHVALEPVESSLAPRAGSDDEGAPLRSLLPEETVKRLLLKSSLLPHLSDIVSIIDADMRFLYVSRTAGGRAMSDVLGTLVLDHIPPATRVGFQRAWAQAWESGEPVTVEASSDDGLYWWENRLIRVADELGASVMFTTTSDITPRKRAEHALRESESRLRDAIAASGIGTFTWEPVVDRVSWDQGAYRIFGLAEEDAPRGYAAYLALVHPEDRARVEAHVAAALQGGAFGDLEHRLVRPDGEIRFVYSRASVARDEHGKVTMLRGGLLDITDRKNLEEQLRQAHKLEAIGQLTAGVAHNFNNLLSIVLPNVELCRPFVASGATSFLDDIAHAAERASELVRQLMLIARREAPLDKRACELTTIVERTVHICRSTFDRAIDIRYQPELASATIEARPGEIEQALLNICINARDALAGVPEARLVLRLVEAGPDSVRVSITDNGPGIAPDVRRRLFEPFFTTKGVGRGTGLGLATAYSMITDHGGQISCESKLGGPTAFHIELPRCAHRAASVPPPAPEKQVTGAETVLVVDDEPMVRRVLRGVLERGGYRVLEAEDGQEGLDTVFKGEHTIDLVLLDRSMPRLSGEGFLEQLRQAGYTLPVVLLTGDPGVEALHATSVMLKPPRASTLLLGVRELLDASRPDPTG